MRLGEYKLQHSLFSGHPLPSAVRRSTRVLSELQPLAGLTQQIADLGRPLLLPPSRPESVKTRSLLW